MPAPKPATLQKAMIYSIAAALCLLFSAARAQEQISTPILATAPNFRDLAGISAKFGGTGYANQTGNSGVMRTGVIYRTDALGHLDPADSATIVGLGIGRDIDLRTTSEIASTPDRVPPGVAYTNINIYGVPTPQPEPPFTAPASEAVGFMQSGYRAFITDGTQRDGLRAVLLTLAHDTFPELYHCSGGKDRTGWTSAILQSIAGVPRETIFKDYLATNSYTADLIRDTKALIMAGTPGANPDTIDALLGVEAGYLQAAFDQVAATYGSMQAYLIQGLGLSQADIYVLRARMVYYTALPGQGGLGGNAAAGAALLGALQDSPLSGRYSAYNYYLQSAVDGGTLGGVPARVGGQVHADAASFLLRQPRRIDTALKGFTSGRGLSQGQSRFWVTGFGGTFRADGHDGIADSEEDSAGSLLGVTRRLGGRATVCAGLGYNWGSVKSSDATVSTNTILASLGGRYWFSALGAGPFVEGRVDAGWVDYSSGRDLGGGLGNASGSTTGAVYGVRATLGDAFRLAPLTITPRVGARLSGLYLGGFDESGSELGLGIESMDKAACSLLAEVDADLDPRQWGAWTVTPAAAIGYERLLGDPQVESTGSIYGFSVSQESAYDSRGLLTAGLTLAAENGGFSIAGMIGGVVGDDAQSTGFGGRLSVGYNF